MTSPTPIPPASPSDAAMQAARELLQMDGILTTYRCAGKGHGAEEQIAAIIDKHLSASLAAAKVENDVRAKDQLKLTNQYDEAKRVVGGVRHENERLRGVERSLRSDLAALRQSVAMLSGERDKLADRLNKARHGIVLLKQNAYGGTDALAYTSLCAVLDILDMALSPQPKEGKA